MRCTGLLSIEPLKALLARLIDPEVTHGWQDLKLQSVFITERNFKNIPFPLPPFLKLLPAEVI